MVNQHVLIGVVNNGENVWWHFSPSLASVVVDDIICVDWQPSVWVDCYAEKAGVCLLKRAAMKSLWQAGAKISR